MFTLVIWLSPVLPEIQLTFVRNPLGLKIEIVSVLVELLYFTIPLLLVAGGMVVIVLWLRPETASKGEQAD